VSLDRASYALIVPLGEGSLRISEVAQRSGVDVSTASRQIVELEKEGVLRRVADPADGRAAVLELTPLGRRHLKMIAKARQEILSEVLSDFSDAEMERLAELLDRLNKRIASYVEGEA
jgi:DNA-binding MarR family transcriptional regulator